MTVTQRDDWFGPIQDSPTIRCRLFCFPYAGGSAALFAQWRSFAPPWLGVYAAELPGRGRRMMETPYRSASTAAEACAAVFEQASDKPFALFGHSMGALIAFEAARRFRASRKAQPASLFVSGCRAPHRLAPDRGTYRLADAAFAQELRRLGGTPDELLSNPELRSLLFPALRADFELSQTYRFEPGAPLTCPVHAFCGASDPESPQEFMQAWRETTLGPFSLSCFDGDHFFLRVHAKAIVQSIAQAVELHSAAAGTCTST